MTELGTKILMKSNLKREHGKYWPVTKWVLIILCLFLLLYLSTIPVRSKLAKSYISQGDNYLIQGKYIAAKLAYRKAQMLSSRNAQAKERGNLTDRSSQNILEIQNLVHEMNLIDQIALFDKATAVPKSEIEAAKTSRELMEMEKYQLAIIPAQTATQMDKSYRDAWLYLGIANLKASTLAEIDSDARNQYQKSAKTALETAKSLDPVYQPTLDWLKQL